MSEERSPLEIDRGRGRSLFNSALARFFCEFLAAAPVRSAPKTGVLRGDQAWTLSSRVCPATGLAPKWSTRRFSCSSARASVGARASSSSRLTQARRGIARSGVVYAESDFELCRAADAILLGALGLPEVVHGDGTEVGPDLQFRLRFDLDLYAGVGPFVAISLRRVPRDARSLRLHHYS